MYLPTDQRGQRSAGAPARVPAHVRALWTVLSLVALVGETAVAVGHTAQAANLFDVKLACGATGNGVTDDSSAIRACIFDAERAGAGATVYFPPGHYMVGACTCSTATISLNVYGGGPIVLEGAGAQSVTITETVPTYHLLSVMTDGTTIEGLTLDSQSHNAMTSLITYASNMSIHDDTFLGGSQTWDVMIAGPAGFGGGQPKVDATGNQITNVTVVNKNADDGFVLEDQSNVTVTGMTLTGSRLSIFFDNGVTVNGYTFNPDWSIPANVDGWAIWGGSSNVTLENLTMNGPGGFVQPNASHPVTSVAIANEHIAGSGYMLKIGDVNGLIINGANLGAGNRLIFNPRVSVANVVVSNAVSLPMVRFKQDPTASVSAAFNNDNFPAPSPSDNFTQTFVTTAAGSTNFTVTGGTWSNQAGGIFLNRGGSTTTTYSLNSLQGYPS